MKTLIIYDTTGQIFSSPITGSYISPQGQLNYLEIEIPDGKILKSVDTTVTPNIPIYEDIPKTDMEKLQEKVEDLIQANAELTSIVAMETPHA